MNITVLVDFDNDSIGTALAVADALGDRLWGVRLDTSERLVDRSLQGLPGVDAHRGVNVELARRVRGALDAAGHARREASSSPAASTRAKIARFEDGRARRWTPTAWARSLLRGANDFTADVVVPGRAAGRARRTRAPAEPAPRARHLSRGAGSTWTTFVVVSSSSSSGRSRSPCRSARVAAPHRPARRPTPR